MVCQACGRPLPAGAQVCPNCGTPAPFNMPGSGIEPTVLANPPGGSGIPPTAYGSAPQNYESAPPPPDPYGQSVPNQYGTPLPPAPNQYGAPPPSGPYPPYGGPQPGGYGVPPQQPKKKSRVGMIIGIVVGVVVLLCIVVSVVVYEVGKNAANNIVTTVEATETANAQTPTVTGNTATAAPTSAPTTAPAGAPSGLPVDTAAATIITNIKSASAIDSNYKPTNVTSTFQTNKTLYVTYDLKMNGSTGYVEIKWYADGQVGATKIFNANSLDYTNGEFSITYTVATQQAAAELYWCKQADCSDEALAGYVNFTVSSSSYHVGSQAPLTFSMAIWRRD